MGVTGLWRLIEPSGKPVPLETLENKVLAVDVSIWLHQAIKGFQDAQGAPLPNAHLLGIYHRVCKLLYFRIKPVFVFDGGVPNLKKETISKRNQQKAKKLTESENIQKQLLTTLLKHTAVSKVLSEKAKASLATATNSSKNATKEKEDIYKLPTSALDSTLSSSEDESTSGSTSTSPLKQWDLHTIDEKSPYFKALPADVRHEILTDLKETRKQSSWGKIHEMPKQSNDFSSFQMKRLLKRYSVQISLEEAEKEMGGRTLSLSELETLLKDQGVVTSSNSVGSRIASDEHTRFVLIKDVQKAIDEAKKLNIIEEEKRVKIDEEIKNIERKKQLDTIEEEQNEKINSNESVDIEEKKAVGKAGEINDSVETTENSIHAANNGDLEFQRDLEKAIQLSLQDMPSTSKDTKEGITSERPKKKFNFSFLDFNDADFESSSESEEESRQRDENILASAKSYMTEYSGLTPNEIAKIIGSSLGLNKKGKNNEVSSTSKSVQIANAAKNDTNIVITVAEQDTNQIVPEETGGGDKVSSSTVDASTINKREGDVFVDNNEVTSSTNKDICSTKLSETNITQDNAVVEIMSDDGSSDEFLEVSENGTATIESKKFEILIKPEDTLEDDIFSDVFSNEAETSNQKSAAESDKNKLKTGSEPEVISSTSNSMEVDICISDDTQKDGKKETTINKTSAKELTKAEQARNIIAEFINTRNAEDTPEINVSNSETGNENKVLTTEQLQEIQENLQQEKAELISERLSKERMAKDLTDEIYQEAQELLQLFGVPYIVAPMEAEAQCAFLDDINLTDGTITDDSDIWLFGGKTVYKNFFNQQKRVMEFRAEDVQHHFKLAREQMVLLALLVGSDYTTGLQGIGPVTALEILAAFPPSKQTEIKLSHQQLISGLEGFRRWLSNARVVGPGKTTLRNKLKNVVLTESFPSVQVVRAYLEPTIDSSNEPFSWGRPDISGLVEFARQKFGWHRVKSEEILKPVLKRLDESRIQRSIKDYFRTKHKIDSGEVESKMSKRVKNAIKKIGAEKGDSSEDDENKANTKKIQKPKRKRVPRTAKKDATDTPGDDEENKIPEDIAGLSSDEDVKVLKKASAESKRKVKQINKEVNNEIEQQQVKKPRTTADLHKKDVIPQKEQDKIDVLRTRMKAIEVLRKSKKGPGFVQKRKAVPRKPKDDAELSESSSD